MKTFGPLDLQKPRRLPIPPRVPRAPGVRGAPKALGPLVAAWLAAVCVPSSGWAEEVGVIRVQMGRKEIREVVVRFYEAEAPETVANFKKLARKGFYKKVAFHRAFPGVLVQAGDPRSRGRDRSRVGTGGPGYTLPAELGRKHRAGSVAMARLPDAVNPARRSNGSQFYVVLQPMPSYDGQHTVFGEVVEGLEVLDAISRRPTDSNDNPIDPVRIRSVRIEER